jgi:hypothetical protein
MGETSFDEFAASFQQSLAIVAAHPLPILINGLLFFFRLCARIWKKPRFAGILKFIESGYTRFHEGERLDEGTGLAWIQGLPGRYR